ncbi:allantoicase [Hyphomicrobium sp. CS1GBMeth3]|uniref:allantoicase n=1 Tax=Hyphomicrobium sp. CS1GBMeth3 TaxID=1892845 RepID=UPI000930C0E7|nr:allantoicase [Hyphomicrobium sp. CS1GBMeth3]
MKRHPDVPDFIYDYVNLASPHLGTEVVEASDEFFAPKERLIEDAPAVFVPDRYDAHGKWMDGWETRRRRTTGNDWCLIKMGVSGIVKGVDIDTSHFTGNFPPAASLEGLFSESTPGPEARWRPLVRTTALAGDVHHYISVADLDVVNWLKLQIYPDGGIARLRVHGIPKREWSAEERESEIELSALKNGGRIIAYNDAHYGNVSALLSEGRGRNMGDGWETRRRREPGNDWIIIALGAPGTIHRIEVDTAYFKGNYPDKCSLQAAYIEQGTHQSLVTQAMFWDELLPPQKLKADSVHTFGGKLVADLGPITHLRLNIFPDGGVSRLRLFGKLA